MSEHKRPKAADGIVTSEKPQRGLHVPIHWRKDLILVGVFVALVAISFFAFKTVSDNHAEKIVIQQQAAVIPDDYSVMTDQQVELKLKSMGLSLADVKSKSISTSDTKTFEQADGVAQTYARLDDYKKSVEFYKVAATSAAGTDYTFYQRYAEAALTAGDAELWKQQLAAAKQSIAKDDKLPASDKQDLTSRIDGQIRRYGLGT